MTSGRLGTPAFAVWAAHFEVDAISVIVLAGGTCRRKALLSVSPGDFLIHRVVANLRALSNDIVLVNAAAELRSMPDVRHVGHLAAHANPLAELYAGLQAVHGPWAFVVACDMPLVDLRLVRYMQLVSESYQAVVPASRHGPEPLHALYHQACLPALAAALADEPQRVARFFRDVRVRSVSEREIAIFDPQGRSFSNANTAEDWERLRQLLADP